MTRSKRILPIALIFTASMALTSIASAAAQAGEPAASTQMANGGPGSASASLSRADKKFVDKAAIGGMTEVQLGAIAEKNASSEQVKAFGARMVKDHTAANDQLKQVASTEGFTLPTELDKAHQKDVDKMSKMSGADFDKSYMKDMVSDHKEDIKDFAHAAKSAKNPGVKEFATKTLPTLHEHLQMAESANAAVK